MKFRNQLVICAVAAILALVLSVGAGFAAPKAKDPESRCLALATTNFGKDVHVDSVEVTSVSEDGKPLPEHCRVVGWRWPDDGFVMKFPFAWNGRYMQGGNGGAAGAVEPAAMNLALSKGFAAGSGTGGHRSPDMMDFSFGYPPGDRIAEIKVEDYCYGSVHKTNILARKMIKAYYGRHPSYAYYDGYSTGGRQGLASAQRYPDDFDGILAGAGPFPFTKRTMGDVWESTQFLGAAFIPKDKLPLLAEAVMAKCDGIDGLVDGLIEDPRKCTFDARTDLTVCPADVEGPGCFTLAQRRAVYNVYDGVRRSDGTLLFRGVSFGSEQLINDPEFYAANGYYPSGWSMFVPEVPEGGTFALGLGGSFTQWVGLPPEKGGEGWDWKTFNVDNDWDIVTDKWAERCDTNNPNLWPFKHHGKKLIYYSGWADALCWPRPAPDYYDSVVDVIGERGTQEFFKLYMVPGMAHFDNGRGVLNSTTIEDPLFTKLVKWVEHGIEPKAVVGSREAVEGLWPAISRPVCPYPQVSKLKKGGNPAIAADFSCVAPPTKHHGHH
jgi:hypothetical protein